MNIIIAIIAAAGIPSAITAMFFSRLQKKMDKTEEKRELKEKQQEQLQTIILEGINGAITLSEATARAVQRIPDAHCNSDSDMRKALDDIERVKERQQRMITAAGVHGIMH